MRSIRVERRILLGLTVAGFVLQAWVIIGEFMLLAFLPGPDRDLASLTVFLLMRCIYAWVLWITLLGVCIWERRYVRQHYPRGEWGASIETLDSFDPGAEEGDWAKAENGMSRMGTVLGYRDAHVTPYREQYAAPRCRKGYDQPPDAPAEGGTDGRRVATTSRLPGAPTPAWKTRLARGDFILGPDVPGHASSSKKEASGSAHLLAGQFNSPEKTPWAAPTAAWNGRWVPPDRHLDRKVIVEGTYGPVLSRTQSI